MKKGFTLIELLGVIILLGIIALITIPIVNSSIRESRQKSYDRQISIIEEASYKWATKNSELLTTETYEVSLRILIKDGFIEKPKNGFLKNPIDGSNMNGCVEITYSTEYNQYIHHYKDTCN